MGKEIIQTQLALFFKEVYQKDFEKISLKLKSVFIGNPQTLIPPIPKDAPDEIPRLSLFFEDFNINVAKNRLDIFTKGFESLILVLGKIHESKLEEEGLSILRMGFVKTYFVEGCLETIKPLLNSELQNLDLRDMNLRINKKIIINDRECNNIETLNIGTITKNDNGSETTQNGILLSRDVNNIPEVNAAIIDQDLQKVLATAFNQETENSDLIK